MSAELFAKYQIAVHNESDAECDEQQFFNFLVDTPLKVIFCSVLVVHGLLFFIKKCLISVNRGKWCQLRFVPSTVLVG